MYSLEALLAYIPPDRRNAIAAGRELPARTEGSALWADISGFTPLTEMLVDKLGPRHGADELALYLNRIYSALIAPVEAAGGSVIDFSGDAITCWFDADSGQQAIAAACTMQVAMRSFENLQLHTGEIISLGIKIAIACGPVRRFRVGDPSIQYIDTMAGVVMDRLAGASKLANTGEILLDEAVQTQWDVSEWRSDPETRRRVAVLHCSNHPPVASSANLANFIAFSEEQIRAWVLPEVFACIQRGRGEFLTELCPAVALFICFEGLNYADEQAGDQLDVLVRHVQHILFEYDGTLLQLTMDNKGSYMYAAFGAPKAHEDDTIRAAAAALKLRLLPEEIKSVQSIRMGMSQGLMRTGGYGGATRRTYGVLGEDVNIAARLMQKAAPGQILVSESIWLENTAFHWEILSLTAIKGSQIMLQPALLIDWYEQNVLDLPPATAAFPLIGRQNELALLHEKLTLAQHGHGQIVSMIGDAGLGKSRLLAEVLQRANGLTCYGGECQSYGTHSTYLVWQPIWWDFFGQRHAVSSAEKLRGIELSLAQVDPDFTQRLPLLDAVLNLSIPDNALTSGMDAKMRKTLRESLLVDCIRARAAQSPLILILEDLHWSDPLSLDLLGEIGRAIQALPVLILLAYRPIGERETDAFLPTLTRLPWHTSIHLAELTPAEAGQLIASHLRNFGLTVPPAPALVKRLSARTQGNPFYIEELLHYQHARGLDPLNEATWEQGDLPETLHSLILSRIDQLGENLQITIKAASVIGRLFRAKWLYEYYPALDAAQVAEDLSALHQLDFLLQDTPEPQLAYLFKHVIMQEVAYENLGYATRANLHEQFAVYLEQTAGEDIGTLLDVLAFHYERSDNLPKKREYLRKAGELARSAFANDVALSYLGRALALAPEDNSAERFSILLSREYIHRLLGRLEEAEQDLIALSALAETLDDHEQRAIVAVRWSIYFQLTNNFSTAIATTQQAAELARLAGATELEARAYWSWGDALASQGHYLEARAKIEQALALAESEKLTEWIANSLMSLGELDASTGNHERAQDYFERALQFQREAGNRVGETRVLACMGVSAYLCGDFARALLHYEQTLYFWRTIGAKKNEAAILTALAFLIAEQRGDPQKARLYSKQAFRLAHEMDDRLSEMTSLYAFSLVELVQNHYLQARVQAEEALQMGHELGLRYYDGMGFKQLGSIAEELGEYITALDYYHKALSILHEMGDRDAVCQVLTALGAVFYRLSQPELAWENSHQALLIAQETKNKFVQNPVLTLQGHLFRESGDFELATASYRQALDLALSLNLPHYAKQAQTGLARIAFTWGNLAEAQQPMDEILHYLASQHLSTIDEIFWIYLTCYHILEAGYDPRAYSTLEAAYTRLQIIAARITDQTQRTSFLQNVRVNREIVETWEGLAVNKTDISDHHLEN